MKHDKGRYAVDGAAHRHRTQLVTKCVSGCDLRFGMPRCAALVTTNTKFVFLARVYQHPLSCELRNGSREAMRRLHWRITGCCSNSATVPGATIAGLP